MLFDLPDFDTLYAALAARDGSLDGQAFVCVASTGIFCRLSCPARTPKPENCTFRATVAECIEAGFRPCKRCHPLGAAAMSDPVVAPLLAALDQDPGRRWLEGDIARMGLDPSTVRRAFKRHFGMTFLEMARLRRLREGFETLAQGGRVIDAQMDAGFESASAFRAAFARLMGCAPGDLQPGGLMQASWVPTPLGDMIAVSSAHHLHLLEFVDRKGLPAELARLRSHSPGGIGLGRLGPTEQVADELSAWFSAGSDRFDTPLMLHGSPFTQAVWQHLRQIPPGETRSYSQLATDLGRAGAARAVARACGANQIALVIPCHRVVGADGSLTGYSGGLWRKQRLIEIEQGLRARR